MLDDFKNAHAFLENAGGLLLLLFFAAMAYFGFAAVRSRRSMWSQLILWSALINLALHGVLALARGVDLILSRLPGTEELWQFLGGVSQLLGGALTLVGGVALIFFAAQDTASGRRKKRRT